MRDGETDPFRQKNINNTRPLVFQCDSCEHRFIVVRFIDWDKQRPYCKKRLNTPKALYKRPYGADVEHHDN